MEGNVLLGEKNTNSNRGCSNHRNSAQKSLFSWGKELDWVLKYNNTYIHTLFRHCFSHISLIDYLSLQQLWYQFPNCVYPNTPCQFSLREETGAPGENPRLLAERALIDSCHINDMSHIIARIEPTISEVKGACSDDCATSESCR